MVLTLAESCKGRSNISEVNRFKLRENKERVGSRQQYVVDVGGEFHSTDGFSEGAGRGWAYDEFSAESVAGLSERRDRGSGRGKQGHGERSRKVSAYREEGSSAGDKSMDKKDISKYLII